MSEHKYHVGQAVEFFPQRGVEHTAKGRFKVVRILLGERNAIGACPGNPVPAGGPRLGKTREMIARSNKPCEAKTV